jgi:predicted amidohydrolase YtcJ
MNDSRSDKPVIHRVLRRTALAAMLSIAAVVALPAAAQPKPEARPAPDTILVNGRIATVDDQFRFVQALAVSGRRIAATGTNADIRKMAGPATKVIDLQGRTVIPGLIDNHSHWVRAAEHDELRFDGITSRAQALKLLADRVRTTPAGEWISVLGGWSEQQFTDDQRSFTRAEIDAIAPNHPVVLQAVY